MPRNKIVMGLAAYGRGWTLESSTPGQGLGAPAIRGCDPMKDTQQEGVANYIEVLTVLNAGGVSAYDAATKTMYVQKGDQWYSYDDPTTIVYKVDYIKDEGLLGGMLWAVDNDDFQNGNPIITAIYNNLYTSRSNTPRFAARAVLVPSIIGGVLLIGAIAAVIGVVASRRHRRELPVVKKPVRQIRV